MSDHVHLLLPVHNRRALSVRFAAALRGQTFRDFTLVLIDDGSTDGTAAAVREVLPGTVVLTGDGRWWWAGCMAAACRWLDARGTPAMAVVGLMNDDVELSADFLAHAVAEVDSHPGTLVLARQLDAESGQPIGCGGGVHVDVDSLRYAPATEPALINCLPTRGLFLRWGDLQRAGGFRPDRLRHYLADYEFTYRAHRRGLALRVADTFSVRTHAGDTGLTQVTLRREPRWRRLRLYFSPRCKDNPGAMLGFAWLVAPAWRRPWLTAKICAGSLFRLVACVLGPTP